VNWPAGPPWIRWRSQGEARCAFTSWCQRGYSMFKPDITCRRAEISFVRIIARNPSQSKPRLSRSVSRMLAGTHGGMTLRQNLAWVAPHFFLHGLLLPFDDACISPEVSPTLLRNPSTADLPPVPQERESSRNIIHRMRISPGITRTSGTHSCAASHFSLRLLIFILRMGGRMFGKEWF